MERINFKELNGLIAMVSSLDEALITMQSDAAAQEEEIRNSAAELLALEALDSLAQIPVEELRNSKAGIRVKALKDAGYHNLGDIARVDDKTLQAVNGIGDKQTISIRAILSVFGKQLVGKQAIRLSMDDDSEQNLRLIRALTVYRMGNVIRRDAVSVQQEFHFSSNDILQRITVRGALRWLFTGRKKKMAVTEAIR